MKTKILLLIIISLILSVSALPAMAATKVIDISNPEKNEVVYKSTFSICGRGLSDGITVEFQIKDKDTDEYKQLKTSEGESSFTINKNGLFAKKIELSKGENQIRIIAFTASTKNDPEQKDYTITLSEEKKKSWFEEKISNITETINSWLGK